MDLENKDQRRPLSVAGHHKWRESLAVPDSRFDEIDEHAADSPPQRRSERETDRLFSILDEIEEERRPA